MTRVLCTGANGFIGSALCKRIITDGVKCRGVIRSSAPISYLPPEVDLVKIDSINALTDWSQPLSDVDVVVHLAARAHVLHETAGDPLTAFRLVNTAGTAQLALKAAEAGVRRFVFVSSIGVNGDITHDQAFREDDSPYPMRPYAVSKWEAEQLLHDISRKTGLEIVIIRPPLVYGSGVKGNMRVLMEYVYRGWPLPFRKVQNRRSFVGLRNLVDALKLCIDRPEAAGHTFLLSDGEDLSTAELIRKIARFMMKKDHLFSIPPLLFSSLAKLTPSLGSKINQVIGSLVVDSTFFRKQMNWVPPYSVDAEIKSMVVEYLRQRESYDKEIV